MFINSKIKNNIADAGFNYYVKNHVSSTNNYLDYGYIRDKAPIVILSNNQRNPRGRRGNKWVDQQNNSLCFSLCLKFNKGVNSYICLSHIVGISIIEACSSLGNNNLKLKWPNDIMQNDKKVCGILIENNIINSRIFYSMIGVGFNISIPDNLLKIIDGNPGNLKIKTEEIDLLISKIVTLIVKNIETFEQEGFTEFKNKWNRNMYALNKNIVLLNKSSDPITGKLIGINSTGGLEIDTGVNVISIEDMTRSLRILN